MAISKNIPDSTSTGIPSPPMLCCPRCGNALRNEGDLRCDPCRMTYPVDRGVPRFVPQDNYAEGFGYQWNRHRLTQLDSHSGLPISRERLFRASRWTAEELRGRQVLECGSGAGRFTEVLCETGAEVTSF